MKKLIFTAFSLIAFSSASIANTISNENEVVISPNLTFKNYVENKSSNKVFKAMTFCEIVGSIAAHEYWVNSNGDTAGATRAGRAAQLSCMIGL